MNDSPVATPASRRDFIKTSGLVVGATALSGVVLPHVHAAGSDQISVALVGCGGRGGGAAANAMSQSGPPKLVAMADVFQNKLDGAFNADDFRTIALTFPATLAPIVQLQTSLRDAVLGDAFWGAKRAVFAAARWRSPCRVLMRAMSRRTSRTRVGFSIWPVADWKRRLNASRFNSPS